MDGWNTNFLLGWPIFRCYVRFRECIPHLLGSGVASHRSFHHVSSSPASDKFKPLWRTKVSRKETEAKPFFGVRYAPMPCTPPGMPRCMREKKVGFWSFNGEVVNYLINIVFFLKAVRKNNHIETRVNPCLVGGKNRFFFKRWEDVSLRISVVKQMPHNDALKPPTWMSQEVSKRLVSRL